MGILLTEKRLPWDIWPLESCLSTEKGLIWGTRHEPPPFPWTEVEWATPLTWPSPEIRFANFFEYTILDPSGPKVSYTIDGRNSKSAWANWPPHPFGVGWGGQLAHERTARPRVYLSVGHMSSPLHGKSIRICMPDILPVRYPLKSRKVPLRKM